jgi:G3E family GTPase
MSDVNIAADPVRAGATLPRSQEKLVKLTSGCICCTLQDNLLQEVRSCLLKGGLIIFRSSRPALPSPCLSQHQP